jgi:flagellar capping protein FliD
MEVRMARITFNTLKYANRLKQAGVSSAQAEAQSEALAEAPETHQSELAIKADLAALKNDITAIKAELAAMEARLNTEMATMEARLNAALEKIALTLFIKLGSLMAGLLALTGGGLALLIRMQ